MATLAGVVGGDLSSTAKPSDPHAQFLGILPSQFGLLVEPVEKDFMN